MTSYMEPRLYDAVNYPSWVIMPTSQSEGEGSKHGSEKNNISPACTACRERHLKCDGMMPICSRCQTTQQDCVYVKSRRGHRPQKKRKEEFSLEQPGDPVVAKKNTLERTFSSEQQTVIYQHPRLEHTASTDSCQDNASPVSVVNDQQLSLTTKSRVPAALPDIQIQSGHASHKLQELYYEHFHDAHPILIPQAHFRAYASTLPPSVTMTMDVIGAAYSSSVNKAQISSTLNTNVPFLVREKSGHTVQALLLHAIAQNCMDMASQGSMTVDSAIDMALELGMNKSSFRCRCCRDDPITRESWRRTWWELYIIDCTRSAVHMKTFFRLATVETDMALPCEEAEYRAGPKYDQDPFYLSDMEESAFVEEDIVFSSYAYRITAIRELGSLLCLNQSFCPDSTMIVTSVDNSLTNWFLHLPEAKLTPVDADGRLDEVIFQAHMIINAALIFLHRPRSDLIFTQVRDTTSCTPARRIAVPAHRYTVHTAKAIEAADRMTGLITLPGKLLKHTPLFTCMLTLAAVVHLSAYAINPKLDQRLMIKERLILEIGALKTIKEIWPIAESVIQKVKAAAREILSYKQPQVQLTLEAPLDPSLYDLANSELWSDPLNDTLFSDIANMGSAGQDFSQPLLA